MSAYILAATDKASAVVIYGYIVFNRNGQALAVFDQNQIDWLENDQSLQHAHVFNEHIEVLLRRLAESSNRFAENSIAKVLPVKKELITGMVEVCFDPLVIQNTAEVLNLDTLPQLITATGRIEQVHRDRQAKQEWDEFLAVWGLTGLPINGV